MNRQNDGRKNMPKLNCPYCGKRFADVPNAQFKNKSHLVTMDVDGKRIQLLDIYFSGVGIVREMTPEEMEKAFQKRLKAEQTKTA